MRSFATAILCGVLLANAANGEVTVTSSSSTSTGGDVSISTGSSTGTFTTTTEVVETPVVTFSETVIEVPGTTTVVEVPITTTTFTTTEVGGELPMDFDTISTTTVVEVPEVTSYSYYMSEMDFFPEQLKQLFENLSADIDSKRAELDVAIREQKDWIATYKSSGSTGMSISDKQKAIDFAELSRNRAEESFSLELKQAKMKLESLKLQATTAKTEWDAAISSYTSAQEFSVTTKMQWETLKTSVSEVANNNALENLAKAQVVAASKKLVYDPLWAEVLRFTSEMKTEIIKARTVLFQEWAQAARAMRVSSEAQNQFQVDLVAQAETVIKEGWVQHSMLVKARKDADLELAAAKAELSKAHQVLFRLSQEGESAEKQEKADLAFVITQQQEKAAEEAAKLIFIEETNQKEQNVQAYYAFEEAQKKAKMISLSFQQNLVYQATERKKVAVENASVAYATWENERNAQRSAGSVDASSSGAVKAKAKIAMYAEEARKAKAMVVEAEKKAQLAAAGYEAKMKELRMTATRNQEETRTMLMKKIMEGQGAAMIQAQSLRQAQALRLKIYQEALMRARQAEMGLSLQQKAMNKALRLVAGQGMALDLAEQRESESMASGMWSTAYQQALKATTSSITTKVTTTTALSKATIALNALKLEVSSITSEKSAAEFKLSLLSAASLKLKAALDVQTESGTRLQILAQGKREEALKKARANAVSYAASIQKKAMERALERHNEFLLLQSEEKTESASSALEIETATTLQITNAKREAELIQAEAKARARVEGEAHILSTNAINDATLALETSARAQEETRFQLQTARTNLKAAMEMQAKLTVKLTLQKTALSTMVKQNSDTDNEWMTKTITTAQNIARKIQYAAEQRSRARWQSLNFQRTAIMRAEQHALMIKAQAEEEKNTNFFTGVLTTLHKEPKNAEGAIIWFNMVKEKIEWRLKQQLRTQVLETKVSQSEAWKTKSVGSNISFRSKAITSTENFAEATEQWEAAQNAVISLKEDLEDASESEDNERLTLDLESAEFKETMALQAMRRAEVIKKAAYNVVQVHVAAEALAKKKTAESQIEAQLAVTELREQKIKVDSLLQCLEKYTKKDDKVKNEWKDCLIILN